MDARNFGILTFLFLIHGISTQSATDPLAGTTVKVTTILDHPFVMKNDDGTYKGFVIDVLNDIAKTLNIKDIKIEVAKDGKYGAKVDNGSYNGMVGELINKEADIAAAPLTVTPERAQVIDFSKPFSTTGLTIMMNREDVFGKDRSAYNLGYFLNPFSVGVWLIILVCLVFVSITMALLNRFDPFEYGARKEEGKLPRGVTGNLGLRESLLFCMSTLAMQGYPRAPLSLAVRVIACFWWFFSVIVIATYIANLVQITQEANTVRNPQFTKLDDVIESDVDLGCLYQGSTFSLFRSSTEEPFNRAWRKMNSDIENFANSTSQAFEKVVGGGYAYLAEFPYADYIVSSNCSAVIVGRLLVSASYAFGFSKNSAWKDKFDQALFDLSRKGKLERYHDKWWHGEHKCFWSKVTDDMIDPRLASGRGPVIPLTLTQFVGPILVLVIGFFLGIIVFIVEVLYYAMATADEKERQSTRPAKV